MPSREFEDLTKRLVSVTRGFWFLGLTSFGGPSVHIGILRERFVVRLKWVSSRTFDDLFALSNALPGPASTQLAFSIALVYAGLIPSIYAFLLWSIPSSLAMLGAALGVRHLPTDLPAVVLYMLSGLNASAVGLIFQAALKLSRTTITDQWTRLILLTTASVGTLVTNAWVFPVLVISGGCITLVIDDKRFQDISGKVLDKVRLSASHGQRTQQQTARDDSIQQQEIEMQSLGQVEPDTSQQEASISRIDSERDGKSDARLRHRHPTPPASPRLSPQQDSEEVQIKHKPSFAVGIAALCILIIVLVTTLAIRGSLDVAPRPLDLFCNLLIAGVIIFGGGPVVIPLLQGYTVDRGWVEIRDFLLGFAILQAMPGPNFAFAVFLGVLSVPQNPALGGFLGYVAIFLPGIMLKLAVLPIYSAFRDHPRVRALLRGLNAAAVGLVFSAGVRLWRAGAVGVFSNSSLDGNLFWYVVSAWTLVLAEFFAIYPAICIGMGAVAGIACWGVVK